MKNLLLLLLSVPFGILSLAAQDKPVDRDSVRQKRPLIFKVVDEIPRLYIEGCESLPTLEERKMCSQKNMLEIVHKNLVYPAEARAKGIEGVAVVMFNVEKDGSLTDIEVYRDFGYGTGEEAIRLVREVLSSLKWVPGKQGGRPVMTQFHLPVKFRLDY